jgi:hypothetical protein
MERFLIRNVILNIRKNKFYYCLIQIYIYHIQFYIFNSFNAFKI